MSFTERIKNKYKRDGFVSVIKHCVKRLFGFFLSFFKLLADKITKAIISFEKRLPLKDYIVFECESDMEDNPRAIYDYLINNKFNKKYHIIWIVNDVEFCRKNYCNHNVAFINRHDNTNINRIRLNYYLYRAKLFIFSHPYWFYKNKEKQFVLNTWHGFGMKSFLTNNSTDISKTFDMAIVPSQLCKDLFSEKWPSEKLKVMEYPRQDYLLSGDKEELLQKITGENVKYRKIIMCMPTFRQTKDWIDSEKNDEYALGVINSIDELYSLNSFLAENNTLMIVKLHPLQNADLLKTDSLSNIIYISNEELFRKKIILYELLGCCDALLTDVSSVYNDFLLLDRPIGFFMDNFINYHRGYIVDNPIDYMPGSYIYNSQDLFDFIVNAVNERDTLSDDRNRIYDLMHCSRDNKNRQRLVEWLFNDCLN